MKYRYQIAENEYVIHFWNGDYFQCFAESKEDALSYLYRCHPYILKEEIQSINEYIL